MIDNSKYLYWLRNDSDALTQEVVWREMYSRIGSLFHIIQMVEYNIANIISIEEYEKETKTELDMMGIERIKAKVKLKFDQLSDLTFGNLAKVVKQSIYLKDIDLEKLDRIKQYRDYLAHRCFKEKLLENKLSSLEDVDGFVDELNDFEVEATEMNEWLLHIFKDNKTKSILLKH
ncbi:MAG: hypothetical protein J5511_05460 [Bacilli bacterium]|nr:hypothetical protein [Bacilli bacterium]